MSCKLYNWYNFEAKQNTCGNMALCVAVIVFHGNIAMKRNILHFSHSFTH